MTPQERGYALAHYAKQWLGVTEIGGDNRGQCVEMFQRAVDGKAEGESWCMAFVQFCLKYVDGLADAIEQADTPRTWCYSSELVMDVWNKTPPEARHASPNVGDLIVWQHYNGSSPTSLGHTGIVVDVTTGGVLTVEGNTSAPDSGDQRQGDGVYLKRRPMGDLGNLRFLGFLSPWQA